MTPEALFWSAPLAAILFFAIRGFLAAGRGE